ncbi:cell adhesion molecule 4-like [Mytilus trossulus]|uniref:cell adhesion molecule 4-like n=1 Tax=Mytilus trossulus TaxID=6551 RepID=UPI00300692CB
MEYPVVNVSNIEPAIEGTNITIPCYVSATSEVTKITWYKNNSILDIYGNDRFSGGTVSSPPLKIYFVEESNEGNYTCQATNPVGTNKSKPTLLQVLPDIPIVLTSEEEAVNIGDNVTLSCNISSVSKLTKVVWSKDNIEFNLNVNHTEDNEILSGGRTLQDHSLTINSVQITDEGNYTCNATNAAEQTGWSDPLHLSVIEGM